MLRSMSVTALLMSNLFVSVSVAADMSADEIMRANRLSGRANDFKAETSLTIIRDGTTELKKMNLWSEPKVNGTDMMALIQFIQPLDLKGSSCLMVQNGDAESDMWVYLPSLGKARRIVSSGKKGSFFGSDFTYSDIERISSTKFNNTLTRIDNESYVIESVMKSDELANYGGYTKKISWIDRRSFVERKVEYYNGDILIKLQIGSRITQVDPKNDIWMPLTREMINLKTGGRTIYSINKHDISVPISASKFTVGALENLK